MTAATSVQRSHLCSGVTKPPFSQPATQTPQNASWTELLSTAYMPSHRRCYANHMYLSNGIANQTQYFLATQLCHSFTNPKLPPVYKTTTIKANRLPSPAAAALTL